MSDTALYLHPLDAGLAEFKRPPSGLRFPPHGWEVIKEWGAGYALQRAGLRAIIDCSLKDDDRWWVHISVSRASSCPSHQDMCLCKTQFLGDRYAYAVYPPQSQYVNLHQYCLHLWALVDEGDGRILPEFSGEFGGVKSI